MARCFRAGILLHRCLEEPYSLLPQSYVILRKP